MFKKLLSLITAAVMAISFISGCSSSSGLESVSADISSDSGSSAPLTEDTSSDKAFSDASAAADTDSAALTTEETSSETTPAETEAETTTAETAAAESEAETEPVTVSVEAVTDASTTAAVTAAVSSAETTASAAASVQTTVPAAATVTTASTSAATAPVSTTAAPATAATTTAAPETTTAATEATTTPVSTETAPSVSENTPALSNLNADENARRLYGYLCENFGTYMLSCQQESTWMGSPDYEMDYIQRTTGKLPAIRGLDFMHDDFSGVVSRAKKWHEMGGIVTICWHCGVNGKGYNESLGDDPDFEKLLTAGTPENKAMLESWDRAAEALAKLRDSGIPVLWRPFHEFDGMWFWWGKGGGENFIKLWQMMYDRYTNEFGLTNLIWVLGYSGEIKSGWYPGNDYCDIIGSDTYDNSTNLNAWKKLDKMDTGKPMAFHECGNVPPVERFLEDGDLWSWFMVWHTEHITGNDKDNLKEVYNHEKVITLDELPEDLFTTLFRKTQTQRPFPNA